MAKDLGYGYDYTHIKEQAWKPRWYGEADEEGLKLRRGLLAALEGRGSLSVKVGLDQDAAPQQQRDPGPPVDPQLPPH
jgi:hypothetical protein